MTTEEKKLHSRILESRSAASTLSDMELFVFPELMYALVLADILSPRIWKWRDDPWFDGLEKMSEYRKVQRIKQYIMDHYVFNLDLETWGMTRRERELERFAPFLSRDEISASNALFGYHGDSYYFDIGIRKHFGLDKYESDVIPYWKTETVEAMDAFRLKRGFTTGAGECVSLAALYAAALFVVGSFPLENLFLMATPLHSQNFLLLGDGILTNNRRIVTKTMWFNGTEISAQARRALEHERVTIVSHPSGWIHLLYPDATIERTEYERFSASLRSYLSGTGADGQADITEPRLPDSGGKNFIETAAPLGIKPGMDRMQILSRLESIRDSNSAADLAFYAYRDLSRTDPLPFCLAAVERNPVCTEATAGMTPGELTAVLDNFADRSIYDDPSRLAQPDEVWNYATGDGVEKALVAAAFFAKRIDPARLSLRLTDGLARLFDGDATLCSFASGKTIKDTELKFARKQ